MYGMTLRSEDKENFDKLTTDNVVRFKEKYASNIQVHNSEGEQA